MARRSPICIGQFRDFAVQRASLKGQDCHGECHNRAKKIVLGSHLKGKQLLDTTIHELLHASKWSLSEVWVDKTAADIATFLWKQGWRPPKGGRP